MSIRAGTAKMRVVICGTSLLIAFCLPVAAQRPVPASERVKACDSAIALAAAEEIIKSPDSLKEPLQLQAAAAVLFDQARKDEAVFWYWMALLQSWYRFPGASVDVMLANMTRPIASPIVNYALQDTRRFEQILTRVQQQDAGATSSKPENQEELYVWLDELRAKIAAQREQIEEKSRAVASQIESRRRLDAPRMCLRVLIHPADARRLIAAEQAQVVEFAKSQADVITAVGVVHSASPGSFTVHQNHLLPSRYEIAVKGDNVVFAIIDVSRDANAAQFKLVCIARTSSLHRDASKDPCTQ